MTFAPSPIWFVTGATGSIGRALIERLDGSVRLRLLVRADSTTAAHRRLAATLGPKGRAALADGVIEPVVGNLRAHDLGLSPGRWPDVTDCLTGVLHIAARTDFDDSADVEAYRDDNVRGALRVLRVAEDAGCAFVHVSSAYVSGVRFGLIGEDELDVGQAHRNGYERSKFEAEEVLRTAANAADVPLTIFRPSIVLPERPRTGATEGPGPLAYLRLLANLEGRRNARERIIRYAGDDNGLLNLVPERFVVDVLARAVTDGVRPGATYHVTARRSFALRDVVGLMNEELAGLRTVLVPKLDATSLDRYERILERSFRMYADYLFLNHEYDRSALDRDFGFDAEHDDGVSHAWLSDTYRAHLRVWRSQRRTPRVVPAEVHAVREYFTRFLPDRTGRRLVPGLASLSETFTVTVPTVGSFAMQIERGILTDVFQTERPAESFDYEADATTLLEVVSGAARPAELFFAKRFVIRGDLYRALSTATALEEFFSLFPFASTPAARSAEAVA